MNETQRGVRDDTLLSSRKGSRVMTVDKNKYILSINGMSKSFGRNKVLKHISLNVKPGTIMGLMGENGAGKSTMMKCLFGTYQKDEGTIVLDGKEVNFSGPKPEKGDFCSYYLRSHSWIRERMRPMESVWLLFFIALM